jgi:sterol desaturase/sphingolipid hydroxylase (fatty acid hydroxylase superfamily)
MAMTIASGGLMRGAAGPAVLLLLGATYWVFLHNPFFARTLPDATWLARLPGADVRLSPPWLVLHGWRVGYLTLSRIFVLALPLVLIELASSAQDRLRWRELYLRPALIWSLWGALTLVVTLAAVQLRSALHVGPIFDVTRLPGWLQIVLFVLLIDFLGYWFHRAEHATPFLWRFHSTHHSIEHLSALNQYENWIEGAFRFPAVYLPASILVTAPDLSVSPLALMFSAWTTYAHCRTRALAFPAWMRLVFADNLYHHVHHGREARFYDRNFGSVFSIWDRLFGTQVLPQPADFPQTGLADVRQPRGLIGYVVHPFSGA